MSYRLPVFLFACWLLAASALEAQRPGAPQQPSVIRATGEAVVDAEPDQVKIRIGVVTQAETAEEAASQNAQRVDAVLEKLKSELADAAELRTTNYSIYPDRRQSRDGISPEIVSYTASNTVEVTLGEIERVGDAIDLATQSGANQIQNIEFGLEDEEAARAEALQQAARDARRKAEALAEALGLRIVRIASVEEGGQAQVQPYRAMAESAAMQRSTPIESGSVEVRAQVTIAVEFAQ